MQEQALVKSNSDARRPGLSMGAQLAALSGLFLAVLTLAWLSLSLVPGLFPDTRWPEALLAVLGAALALSALARQLPGQNLVLAGLFIALCSVAMQRISTVTGHAIGPGILVPSAHGTHGYARAGLVCLLWIAVVLNSRATAQLILRPWRERGAYGLWLLGLATALAVEMGWSITPFTTGGDGLWAGVPRGSGGPTQAMGWLGALSWALIALILLALISPTLISKKPVSFRPCYPALGVWLAPNLLLVTAAGVHGLWAEGGAAGVASLAVATLAVAGGRRVAKFPDPETRPTDPAPGA
jgi:hypothetical protein